jgi:hypothetical protein
VLKLHDISSIEISGLMSITQHQKALDHFSDPNSSIPVLLSSDIGAVGLNIQAANIVLLIVSSFNGVEHPVMIIASITTKSAMVRAGLPPNHWACAMKGTNEACLHFDIHCFAHC